MNNTDVPANADLVFFFRIFLTDNLVDEMVREINAYAEILTKKSRPLRSSSILTLWKPTNADEMKTS